MAIEEIVLNEKEKKKERKKEKKKKENPGIYAYLVGDRGFLTVCFASDTEEARTRSRRARREGDFIEMDWTPRRSLRHEG